MAMMTPQIKALEVLKELIRWLVDIWRMKFSNEIKVRRLFEVFKPFKLLPMIIYMAVTSISKVYTYEVLWAGDLCSL